METNSRFAEFTNRLTSLKAKDMMTRSVITVKKEMSLASLSEMILQKKISGVPVADDGGKVIGIVTATDLFTLMQMLKAGQIAENGKEGVCNPTVDFAMNHDVFSVSEETSLDEILNIMQSRNIHTLPVMKDGVLLGIIGRRDVLKYFYAIVKELFEN